MGQRYTLYIHACLILLILFNSCVNFSKGEPNNWNGHEDCQEFDLMNNQANDITCTMHYCIICQLSTNTVFHFQGGKSKSICCKI